MRYLLQVRITVAVSFLALGMLFMAAWTGLSAFERHYKSNAFYHLENTLDLVGHELSGRILQAQLVLEHMATNVPHSIIDQPEALKDYLEKHEMAEIIFDNALTFFDASGVLMAVSPWQEEVVGVDFSFREYYQVTKSTRHRFISRPFLSRQRHTHPVVLFTEPVLTESGEFLGFFGGSLDLYGENILGTLFNETLYDNGYFILMDHYDSLVMHPDPKRIMESWREVISQSLGDDIWLQSRGLIDGAVLDGQEMLGAFQHMSPSDWTLMALVPSEEVLAPVQRVRLWVICSLALLSVLMVWLIWRLTKRYTLPLSELTDHVRQLVVDADNFDTSDIKDFPELGDLANSIRELLNVVVHKRKGLQDQLAFLENLLEAIPLPVFYKDAGFRYIGCNKVFLDFLGINRDDLIGRRVHDLFDKKDAQLYHEADLALWEKGNEQIYETKFRHADGTERDVVFHKKLFLDAEGVPAGLIGVFFDLTDRKRWEEIIRSSETRFRLLVENAADAFYLFNASGEILDVNRHACLDLGYTRDELQTMKVSEVSAEFSQEFIDAKVVNLKKDHQTTMEDTMLCKDGSTFPAEVRICHVERDGDLFIALARDITERRRSEQALYDALSEARASRDQVENIISSVADGVIVVDQKRRVRVVNHVAEEILGVSSDEVLGAPFTCLLKTDELRTQIQRFLNLSRSEASQFDLSLTRPGAQFPRIVQARSSRLYDADRNPSGIVTLLHDVTREREIDRVKSEFISTAAHELRTPLAVVLGYCELLLNNEDFGDFDGEEQQQFLLEIYKKGLSLTRIVDDLFDISRIEAGLPLPLDLSICNLSELIRDIAGRYDSASEVHNVLLDLDCDREIRADCGKLTQVVENLLSNAVKYSPDGGDIKVSCLPLDDAYLVRIFDEGIGMSPEQLGRVFDKFYRADSTNTAIGGLGIGMSIVKAIIETHGGEIKVESTIHKGTRVQFTLPFSPKGTGSEG